MYGRPGGFSSRDIALIAGLAALYLAYGYASGVALGNTVLSLDLFFLIAALFAVLAGVTKKMWSATALGTVTGLIFLGTPSAPFPAHITLSLIANGLVFDLYLKLRHFEKDHDLRNNLVIAGALGNFVMVPVGLGSLQAFGISTPSVLWAISLVGNTVVGALGALLGSIVITRLGARRTQPLVR